VNFRKYRELPSHLHFSGYISELPLSASWILCFHARSSYCHFWNSYRNNESDIPLERCWNFAAFSFRRFFQIHDDLILFLNILNSIFANFTVFIQYFGRYFWTAYRIDAYNIPLKWYENCATFCFRLFSQRCYGLGADLNLQNSVFTNLSNFVLFGLIFFETVCRIDPYDIPFENCENCAPFSCCKFFQIIYRFKLILNILKVEMVDVLLTVRN
jgi:hypothetical protein